MMKNRSDIPLILSHHGGDGGVGGKGSELNAENSAKEAPLQRGFQLVKNVSGIVKGRGLSPMRSGNQRHIRRNKSPKSGGSLVLLAARKPVGYWAQAVASSKNEVFHNLQFVIKQHDIRKGTVFEQKAAGHLADAGEAHLFV